MFPEFPPAAGSWPSEDLDGVIDQFNPRLPLDQAGHPREDLRGVICGGADAGKSQRGAAPAVLPVPLGGAHPELPAGAVEETLDDAPLVFQTARTRQAQLNPQNRDDHLIPPPPPPPPPPTPAPPPPARPT